MNCHNWSDIRSLVVVQMFLGTIPIKLNECATTLTEKNGIQFGLLACAPRHLPKWQQVNLAQKANPINLKAFSG